MQPSSGKKSVRWDKDPEILRRLDAVASMMIRGAKLWQIAQELDYSLTSADNDKKRVRILWSRDVQDTVAEKRERSIATYRQLQTTAWSMFDASKDKPKVAIALREIRECEAAIVALEGTNAPKILEMSGPGGKPIEITEGDLGLGAEELAEWRKTQASLIELVAMPTD